MPTDDPPRKTSTQFLESDRRKALAANLTLQIFLVQLPANVVQEPQGGRKQLLPLCQTRFSSQQIAHRGVNGDACSRKQPDNVRDYVS
jgi:hypothetical protein